MDIMIRCFLGFLVFLSILACTKQSEDLLIDCRDGKEYQTVRIGEQVWMAENLAYMPYVSRRSEESGIWVFGYDGDSHDWAKKLPEYKTYGCLYSWAVAMNVDPRYDSTLLACTDVMHQGICPDGWHLPSDAEWSELEEYLDMNPGFESDDDRQHSGTAGVCLKADTLWQTPSDHKKKVNFNALPSGMFYHTHYFLNLGTYGYFWTATEKYPESAIYRYLKDGSDGTFRGFPSKHNGHSVRCIRDN